MMMKRLLLCALFMSTAKKSDNKDLPPTKVSDGIDPARTDYHNRTLSMFGRETAIFYTSSGTQESDLEPTMSIERILSVGGRIDWNNFTNGSSEDAKLMFYYDNIRANIWTYVPPVIITVGVPCNILSFVTWVRSLA